MNEGFEGLFWDNYPYILNKITEAIIKGKVLICNHGTDLL
jgi:hypothetical protein